MFGLWFSLKVHGLQIGAPIKKWSSIGDRSIIRAGVHEESHQTTAVPVDLL